MNEHNDDGPPGADGTDMSRGRDQAARLFRAAALPVAAAAVILGGLLLAYRVGEPEQTFGFVTYAPLAAGDSLLILTAGMQLGWLLMLLGLVLGAAWGGYRLGLRRRGTRGR